MASPPAAFPTLSLIRGHVGALNRVWHIYAALLIRKPRTAAPLNQRTGYLSQHFVGVMGDWLITEICKLLDPAESKVRGNRTANLTLETCIASVASAGTPTFDEQRARTKLRQIRHRFSAFRQHRNKRTAHTDYESAIPSTVLPSIARKEIGYAVDEIIALYGGLWNAMYTHPFAIDDGGKGDSEVRILLRLLRIGNAQLDRTK